MAYCVKHKVEFDSQLWCPMCLEEEATFKDELAREAAEDSKYFEEEDLKS